MLNNLRCWYIHALTTLYEFGVVNQLGKQLCCGCTNPHGPACGYSNFPVRVKVHGLSPVCLSVADWKHTVAISHGLMAIWSSCAVVKSSSSSSSRMEHRCALLIKSCGNEI